MFALVDGNNFYASCERVFNPSLWGQPVGVLSNNDGCIIARSQELKDLGVPMGAPAFKWTDTFKYHDVKLFSANFPLYGDMSRRMMNILKLKTPHVEVYSIDEAFVDLSGLSVEKIKSFIFEINGVIPKWIGIPVGIGVAPTKTLAKLANKLSKKTKRPILLNKKSTIDQALKQTAVGEVWGIGSRLTKRLSVHGITTAYDLANCDISLIRNFYSVVEEKIIRELQGQSCMSIEEIKPKKQIITSRNFGNKITDYDHLSESIFHFVSVASEKLRKQNSYAGGIEVHITTDPFGDGERYSKKASVKIEYTSSTQSLMNHAADLLSKIFLAGLVYKKAGVVLKDIISTQDYQPTFLNDNPNTDSRLEQVMDNLNQRYGKRVVTLGHINPAQSPWWMNQKKLSPNYCSFDNMMTVKG